jgi:hypothetical protein
VDEEVQVSFSTAIRLAFDLGGRNGNIVTVTKDRRVTKGWVAVACNDLRPAPERIGATIIGAHAQGAITVTFVDPLLRKSRIGQFERKPKLQPVAAATLAVAKLSAKKKNLSAAQKFGAAASAAAAAAAAAIRASTSVVTTMADADQAVSLLMEHAAEEAGAAEAAAAAAAENAEAEAAAAAAAKTKAEVEAKARQEAVAKKEAETKAKLEAEEKARASAKEAKAKAEVDVAKRAKGAAAAGAAAAAALTAAAVSMEVAKKAKLSADAAAEYYRLKEASEAGKEPVVIERNAPTKKIKTMGALATLPPRAKVEKPERTMMMMLTKPQPKQAKKKKGPCDKCDGDHHADDCPHFKKKREKHSDATDKLNQKGGSDNGVGGGAVVIKGARKIKQPGDGSCLYHSMSYGLKGGAGASALRKEIANYIGANPNESLNGTPIRDWVLWDTGLDVKQYAAKMGSSSCWGGGIEMAVCVLIKRVNLHVYEARRGNSHERISAFEAPDPAGAPTVSVVYSGSVHYDALIP